MRGRITKRVVDQLQPGEIFWDDEMRGFGVRCRSSGAKHYVLKYRVGGRQRWYTIGRHGSPWTPHSARKEATSLLGLVANHCDPAADRDAGRSAKTVAELGQRFLTEYVPHQCKPSTAREYHRCVELFINPALGRLNVADVTTDDVANFHYELGDIPFQANRALGVLSKMMNLAEVWRLRQTTSNPCRHIRKYHERKRERYLSNSEFARLGKALDATEREGTFLPSAITAIRLLILTGARLSEILTLRWDYIDWDRSCIALPESKTGAKLIYLSPPALDILRTAPRTEGNPYVVPGKIPESHLSNLQKPWRHVRQLAGLDDVRIHDLRHSYASLGAVNGLSLPMIGKLLGQG